MKRNKLIAILLIAVFALPLLLVACDGDECFEENNYKSNPTEKVAPGTQPVEQTDC